MAKKGIITAIFLIIIGFSLIIIFPIPLLSNKLSSYDIIDWAHPYYFKPSSPSPIEKLYINTDVGNIEIQYIDLPVNYHVKLDVNIEMSGAKLSGKNYSHFFNIIWYTTSSSAHLALELLSDDWFDNSLWDIKNVNILVTIRADIVFDIITNLGDGDFKITVPYAVSIGNLITNVSNGNISYDFGYFSSIEGNLTGSVDMGNILYTFEHCTFEGNMTGIVNEGNIDIFTNNVKYTRNSIWDFNITSGNINFYIHQFEDIGANITGFVRITNGYVFILYEDNSPDVGAILKIPFGNDFMHKGDLPGCLISIFGANCDLVVDGFQYPLDLGTVSEAPHEGIVFFTSNDLLANVVKYFYNITFEIQEGTFDMALTSLG